MVKTVKRLWNAINGAMRIKYFWEPFPIMKRVKGAKVCAFEIPPGSILINSKVFFGNNILPEKMIKLQSILSGGEEVRWEMVGFENEEELLDMNPIKLIKIIYAHYLWAETREKHGGLIQSLDHLA